MQFNIFHLVNGQWHLQETREATSRRQLMAGIRGIIPVPSGSRRNEITQLNLRNRSKWRGNMKIVPA